MTRAFGSGAGGLGTTLAACALVAAMAGAAAAQCGGTQLCAPGAGDCTVDAACTITLPSGGLTIDLGARRLVITRTLTVQGPAGGSLTIRAGDVLIDGGTITLPGANGVAGVLTILSDSNLAGTNTAVIDVNGSDSAGVVDLQALGGDLNFNGRIRANGVATRMGYGGEIDLYASGSMTIDGPGLDVSGGDLGGAGFLSLETTTGSVNLTAPLKAFGADGGDIEISAGTTLQTSGAAQFNVDANGDAGSGGSVDLSAEGNIVIGGETIGSGTLPDFQMDGKSGGDGADFDIFSNSGSVTLNGRITVNAAAGGSGGTIDFEAGQNLTITKPIFATSGGLDGIGGDIFLTAGAITSLQESIDASGSIGSGGSIEVFGLGNVTISNNLLTDGDLFGGTILVTGCAVNVTASAILSARGAGGLLLGSNEISASSTMTIAGTLRATTRNLLEYRSAPAPSVTGTVTPAATVTLDPTLMCCVSCPVTTTTTFTTSTTSTTATTVGTTSTTSSTIAVSTTTSTTAPPSTTTTSAPPTTSLPPTTTTSLPPVTTTTLPPSSTTTSAPPTTSTTASTTTSTAAPPTTSTTTSPTTSTTATTTEPTSTTFVTPTTTVQSSTSTSTSPAPVTTTTQPVTPSCGSNGVLSGASTCSVALLTAQVNGATLEQLGGKATANRLRAILRRADRFLGLARGGKKVGPSLRRALRQIKSFERAVQQGLHRKRRPIDTAVGTSFLSLSVDARSEIGSLQTSTR